MTNHAKPRTGPINTSDPPCDPLERAAMPLEIRISKSLPSGVPRLIRVYGMTSSACEPGQVSPREGKPAGVGCRPLYRRTTRPGRVSYWATRVQRGTPPSCCFAAFAGDRQPLELDGAGSERDSARIDLLCGGNDVDAPGFRCEAEARHPEFVLSGTQPPSGALRRAVCPATLRCPAARPRGG